MIQLKRLRTSDDIPAAFRGAGRKKSELDLLTARRDHLIRLRTDPKAGHKYPSSWWKDAKDTLSAESAGKCAYCEARAEVSTYCDVEHIRPKDEWWWLTRCWDNYCFSCQICNQKYKKNYFPVAGPLAASPTVLDLSTDAELQAWAGTLAPDPLDSAEVAAFSAAITGEDPDLPDPYFDNPEALFAWNVLPDSGRVFLIARDNSARARRAVVAAEKYYGINREPLCELRYETFDALAMAKETLDDPGVTDARRKKILAKLSGYLDASRSFSAMSRYFICDAWQLLPRPN